MAFPSTLDDFTPKVDNTNDVMAIDVNELQTALEALEAKVGIDASDVTSSLDYLIKAASNPGHTHTAYEPTIGFTPENVANKSTDITTDGASDTKYPSAKAVKTYADGLVAGLLDYRGAYNASVNTFPASGGSGSAGAVLKGDMWIISVAGTLGGVAVQVGDSVIANTDTPGQTAGNWNSLNSNISYVPEDVANKVTSISGASTDTQYPTAKLVYDLLALKINNSLVDAKGDLITATADNTPARLALGNNGEVLTVDTSTATGLKYAAASGGSSLWTMPTGATRVSNTTFTVTGDQTAIFAKGVIVKWTESGTVRTGVVSIPSTVSTDTTVTIIGDTMASIDASSLKYCMLGAEMFTKMFAYAGAIGAVATGVANTITATEPMRLLGADLWVGTAGTTNSTTVDININGTTAFTTKPTLATTVQSSPTPFTADTAKSLSLGDDLTLDIDAIQTTVAQDLYVLVYLFPTRYLNLA